MPFDLPPERARWLECQTCGHSIIRMSIEEARSVAANPYAYIVYCTDCQKDVMKQLMEEENK